ncbi:hypothetical protein [Halorubrum trueperi]|uniref:Uncharacterized protein n=1 Tax=Halorubrum trueperi TaxID=2004704 RepID=A0ABD5UMQ3_9EURY
MTGNSQPEAECRSIVDVNSEIDLSQTVQTDLELFDEEKLAQEQFQLIVKVLSIDWWGEILSSPEWNTEPVTKEVVIQRISAAEGISELSAWTIYSMAVSGIPIGGNYEIEIEDVTFDSPALVWVTAMTVKYIEERGICPRFNNRRRSFELEPTILFDIVASGDPQKTTTKKELIEHIVSNSGMDRSVALSVIDKMIEDDFFEVTDNGKLVLQDWVRDISLVERERIHITSPSFRGL